MSEKRFPDAISPKTHHHHKQQFQFSTRESKSRNKIKKIHHQKHESRQWMGKMLNMSEHEERSKCDAANRAEAIKNK